jgi:hypothetical protein
MKRAIEVLRLTGFVIGFGMLLWVYSGCASNTSAHDRTSKKSPGLSEESKDQATGGYVGLEGDTRLIIGIERDQKSGREIVTLGAPGVQIGGIGLGGFTKMPGKHTFRWVSVQGEQHVIKGEAFVGIRSESPRIFDFALIVESPAMIPSAVSAQKDRLRLLNADSVFLSKSFRLADKVAWVCKIEKVGNEMKFVDW